MVSMGGDDLKCECGWSEKRYGTVDLLTGGFPCQPFSVAGKQGGSSDDRHLWPEMFRVIQEAKPTWIIGENVAGIINTLEFEQCFLDLESEGYEAKPFIIPACAADAKHRRNRVWIIANSNSARSGGDEKHEVCSRRNAIESCVNSMANSDICEQGKIERDNEKMCRFQEKKCEPKHGSAISGRSRGNVPRSSGNGLEGSIHPGDSRQESYGIIQGSKAPGRDSKKRQVQWEAEPAVGRVANGIPSRVDRLKGLGNAIVPQVVVPIMQAIKEIEGGQ